MYLFNVSPLVCVLHEDKNSDIVITPIYSLPDTMPDMQEGLRK